MCRRYPGIRPSDYLGIDNDYQAFKFDLGVAWKSHLKELERDQEYISVLLNGFRNVVLSNGANMPKIPKPTPMVKPKNYDDVPLLSDILKSMSGVVEYK